MWTGSPINPVSYSGEFYRVLEEAFGGEHELLVLSEIENKEGIYESIKKFLGKGK